MVSNQQAADFSFRECWVQRLPTAFLTPRASFPVYISAQSCCSPFPRVVFPITPFFSPSPPFRYVSLFNIHRRISDYSVSKFYKALRDILWFYGCCHIPLLPGVRSHRLRCGQRRLLSPVSLLIPVTLRLSVPYLQLSLLSAVRKYPETVARFLLCHLLIQRHQEENDVMINAINDWSLNSSRCKHYSQLVLSS